jgi:SAM-dependent methyltransferase
MIVPEMMVLSAAGRTLRPIDTMTGQRAAKRGAEEPAPEALDAEPAAIQHVRAAYDADPELEWNRLEGGTQARLEYLVTTHALRRHLPSPPDGVRCHRRVLDAGGGPGRYTINLAAKGFAVTLLDLSPALLDVARGRITAAGPAIADRVEAVVQGSITDLSRFPDESFDAVLCLGGPLSHLIDARDRRAALRELRRVARPGAPLLISVMNRLGAYRTVVQWADSWALVFPHLARSGESTLASGAPAYFFLPEEFHALLEDSGLTVERLYGTAGLGAHLHEDRLAALMADPQRWPLWQDLLLATCDHPNVVGVSNHLLAAVRRPPESPGADRP